MLTSRGWWFFVALLALATLALMTQARAMTLVLLTLLVWFLAQWLLFAIRLRLCRGRLRVERHLADERGKLSALWARQHAAIEVALIYDGPWTLPYVLAIDRVPPLACVEEGRHHSAGALGRAQPLAFTYRIVCPAPGILLFLGLKVHLADLHGFFTAALFVRDQRRFRVLPPLVDVRGKFHAIKRRNLIPLMGTHRHRRAGSGSELLDVRDYLPGDPPKMIAWKASARRDRLMTKEYESDVPIRCTLFVDVSSGVRLGPVGRTPLARLVEIAATVAQANAAARDLTGLCLFDEQQVHSWDRPTRGSRHLTGLMDRLTNAAALTPQAQLGPLDRFLPLAYGLAQDIYPDLLDEDVNAFPWWLPLWAPRPAFTVPRPPYQPRSLFAKLIHALRRLFQDSPFALLPKGGARFSPKAHRMYRWRKKLASILSVHYGLAPSGLARLLEDDWDCFHYVQRFLGEHQVSCPTPLYDARGHYLFASSDKWQRLARALMTATRRGRDNELFVLLADFLEGGPQLDQVQRAVRLARAKHHQVLIVCPWPPSVDTPPGRDASAPPRLEEITPKAHGLRPVGLEATLQDFLWQASTARLHQAYEEVRRMFAAVGVPVVCARQDDVPALILHRMNLLRGLERGVR